MRFRYFGAAILGMLPKSIDVNRRIQLSCLTQAAQLLNLIAPIC
ncbi:hypothetical protein Bphyt_5188 [Paraburkholderia phytofirmans PsJN]|uniref:Uncharacterized protein n=1 Tax=Paraburkholderia phytofirmans (strain DSM 17436 / LMG 22146 / PsJN) TaxID=398527 RepID=B2TCX3_PARPJ|nr:hypothetical protein Bphyt_5188 [Paraburkholderia phytofirmans PsJN]